MWKTINGRLVHITDTTRKSYKTIISKAMIDELKEVAERHDSTVGFLLENGYEHLLESKEEIVYRKGHRPKDRVEFRTTCDEVIFTKIKALAKENKINLNDLIEYSMQYIKPEEAKKEKHRYRVE